MPSIIVIAIPLKMGYQKGSPTGVPRLRPLRVALLSCRATIAADRGGCPPGVSSGFRTSGGGGVTDLARVGVYDIVVMVSG